MGHYTHFSDLEAKYRALADAAGVAAATPPAFRERRVIRRFVSLRKSLVVAREAVAVLALKASQKILREEIYERYIPSREEYRNLSKTGGKQGAKQAKQRAALQRAHRGPAGPLRTMQPRAEGREWERTGVLAAREKVASGEDVLGDFIVLRNDAANKRASLYAIPRKDLGTMGHRRNSAWTKTVNWQAGAFMEVRVVWLGMLARAIQKVLNQ